MYPMIKLLFPLELQLRVWIITYIVLLNSAGLKHRFLFLFYYLVVTYHCYFTSVTSVMILQLSSRRNLPVIHVPYLPLFLLMYLFILVCGVLNILLLSFLGAYFLGWWTGEELVVVVFCGGKSRIHHEVCKWWNDSLSYQTISEWSLLLCAVVTLMEFSISVLVLHQICFPYVADRIFSRIIEFWKLS